MIILDRWRAALMAKAVQHLAHSGADFARCGCKTQVPVIPAREPGRTALSGEASALHKGLIICLLSLRSQAWRLPAPYATHCLNPAPRINLWTPVIEVFVELQSEVTSTVLAKGGTRLMVVDRH